jgi:hypothetical protein
MWKSNAHLAFVFMAFISAIIENQILGMLHFNSMTFLQARRHYNGGYRELE